MYLLLRTAAEFSLEKVAGMWEEAIGVSAGGGRLASLAPLASA
jgi:hypothetical protein